MYVMEYYYSAIKEKEILSFATTWMNSEGTTLSDVSQRKTETVHSHLHVESKKAERGETEWRWLGKGKMLVKVNKLPVTR